MAEFTQGSPIIIPFGADKVMADQIFLSETADGMEIHCRIPHVVIDRADRLPLRLNSGGLEFGEAPPLAQMPEVPDQLAYLLTHFQRHCTVWDKYPRAFLDRYFAFIHGQMMENRPELTKSLAKFKDLYRFDQWAFSALRPLPRAHLWAPENAEIREFDAGQMLRVNFAFWTGAEIVAIDLIGTETRGEAHATRRNRLTRNGVKIIEMRHEYLGETRSSDFAASLPPEFHGFWKTQPLPAGPFRTIPLPDPT